MSGAAAFPDRSLAGLGLMRLRVVGPAPDPARKITAIRVDSREVKPGDLFAAMPGTNLDGASFAQYAVRQGAAAVLATAQGVETARSDIGGLPVPFFIAPNPRLELARLAAAFYARQPEVMVAVTGTNGKTSTAHFLRQIWAACGRRAASFGTTGVEGAPGLEGPGQTTPEPISLHRFLAELTGHGISHAAMEASSHGLAQYRVDGVRLLAAGLSNITRDHMDYHDSHADYVQAKQRLFAEVLPEDGTAVVNLDDNAAVATISIAAERGLGVITCGHAKDADLRIRSQHFQPHGQWLDFTWEGGLQSVHLPLIGAFQAENVLLAAGLAIATGEAPERVFEALPKLSGVRGRMERVAQRANGAAVFVDYAHTPDALATAIAALRPHCEGRLIVAFGAGGDRDPGKRILMGQAAAAAADHAIVTDDNPRSEDPAAIRRAVMAGVPEGEEIAGRAEAILSGVDALKEPGDCLLIAGKGHELGQEIGGETLPFDDAEQARAAVAALDGTDPAMDGGPSAE